MQSNRNVKFYRLQYLQVRQKKKKNAFLAYPFGKQKNLLERVRRVRIVKQVTE